MYLKNLFNSLFIYPVGESFLVFTLMIAWVDPAAIENFHPGFISSLPIIFVAEFVMGHASVGFCLPIFFEGILRWLSGIFIICLYSMFFYFLFVAGNPLQVVTFLWITISRLYRSEHNFLEKDKEKLSRSLMFQRLASPALLKTFFLCICLAVATTLPLPELGLAGYYNAHGSKQSGYLVEHPESVIFLLIIYFTFLPMLEKKVFPSIAKKFE